METDIYHDLGHRRRNTDKRRKKLPQASKSELPHTDSMSTNADKSKMTTSNDTNNEVARLREENKEIRKLLKRCVKLTDKILMEMPRPYPVMWFVELSEEIGGIYEQLAALAPAPEEPDNAQ